MRQIKYGGNLRPGDFIAISDSNHLTFGWYFGDGVGGTLQYYYMSSPINSYESYQDWEKMPPVERQKSWHNKKYNKGFSLKCLWKGYINAVHNTRVMKLTNPEEVFTEEKDRELYKQSKEVLIKLNFVKP